MSLLGSKSAKKKGADAAADSAKPSKADKKAEKAAKAAAKAAAKSASKAAAPAGRGVVVEKPKANIYTALLVLSFVAIVVACICLYAEMNAYEWKFK
jgi:hypothetical protein